MPIAGVNDLQGPSTVRLLAPEVHAEERPVVEVGAEDVARPFEQQGRCRAHRRGQQQPQVASGEEPQGDLFHDVKLESRGFRRERINQANDRQRRTLVMRLINHYSSNLTL